MSLGTGQSECRRLRTLLGLSEHVTTIRPALVSSMPKWVQHYILGVEAELYLDNQAAEAHYLSALSERPNSFWGHYRAASAAFEQGGMANWSHWTANSVADAHLKKAKSEQLLSRARAEEAAAAEAFARAENDKADARQHFADATPPLKVCVDQRPDNPALRRQYAGCLFGQQRFQEAVDQCVKAVSLHPD